MREETNQSLSRPGLKRVKDLYESGLLQREIADDAEVKATVLKGIEKPSSRRWKVFHVINAMAQEGIIQKRSNDPAKAAPPVSGPTHTSQLDKKTRDLYLEHLAEYETYIGAATQRRSYEPRNLRGRTETVVISDPHIPDERMDLLAEIALRHKGAHCSLAGDINDFEIFGRFDLRDWTAPQLQSSLARTDAVLSFLTTHFAGVDLLMGNHDLRLPRKAAKQLGPDYHFVCQSFLLSAYEQRHGVKVIQQNILKENGRHLPSLFFFQQIGDCVIGHVEAGGKPVGAGVMIAHDFFFSRRELLKLEPFRLILQAHCFSADTEVLTRLGWKTFDRVVVGEEVLTYNMQTGASEWNSIQEVVHYDHFKELIHFKSDLTDLLVTPDHAIVGTSPQHPKTLPYRRDEAKNWIGKRVQMPCGGQNINPDYPIDDNLLRLLGWVITEGNYCRDSCNIRISQSDKPKVGVTHITDICQLVGVRYSVSQKYKAGVTEHGQHRNFDAYTVRLLSDPLTKQIRAMLPEKQIGAWVLNLSARQFELFFAEIMLADGSKSKGSSVCYQYSSKNEEEIDFLQAACALNGYRSTKIKRNRQNDFYVLSVCQRGSSMINGGQIESYEGRVWCVRVKNQTLIVRRNGKVVVSGNTHKQCFLRHPLTGVHLYEIGCLSDEQAYSLLQPRYGPLQRGYYHLVQYDGVTDLDESRLYSF